MFDLPALVDPPDNPKKLSRNRCGAVNLSSVGTCLRLVVSVQKKIIDLLIILVGSTRAVCHARSDVIIGASSHITYHTIVYHSDRVRSTCYSVAKDRDKALSISGEMWGHFFECACQQHDAHGTISLTTDAST